MTEDKAIGDMIAEKAREIKDPANRPVRVIPEAEGQEVAGQAGVGLGHVYESALQADIWPLRYLRHAGTLSCAEQLRLARSGVAVIGAGGLGAAVVMLLARLGIGRLTVADPDVFEETNLNRQLPANRDTLGRGKAEAVQTLAAAVNPAIAVRSFPVALGRDNAADILAGADVAVDALDTISTRLILAAACRQTGIPLVHAAVAGFEGQVMTIFPEDAGLDQVYGNAGPEDPPAEAPENLLGVTGIAATVLAGLEAMEVVKILLGRGRLLRSRMLYLDLENAGFQELSFSGDAADRD